MPSSSPTPEQSADFRFIDARPEPARQQQPQPQSSTAPQTANAPPVNLGMDVDDEDMEEIAKFLPMLHESSRP